MSLTHLTHCEEFDCHLLDRVRAFLCQRGYAPLRTLTVAVERGVVVLQGVLPTYYLRQVALACSKRVAGVTAVIDHIEVPEAIPTTIRRIKNLHSSPPVVREVVEIVTL